MLQAIIGDDEIAFRMAGKQAPRRSHPVTPDENRAGGSPGEQPRFVAHCLGIAVSGDLADMTAVTAVAATDDAWMSAAGTQRQRQMDHQRRLAGAADRYVADDDHRYRQVLTMQHPDPVAGPSRGDERFEDQ